MNAPEADVAFQPPTGRGRVLVVDDETQLLSTLCEMLQQEGYQTQGFVSGAEALPALRQGDFEVLLADLMMPGMDGITLMRESLGIDPHLVCILMTGQGTVSTAVEAMKSGAFDYLLKPFKLSAILPLLERAVQVRRLRLENVQLRETVGIYSLTQSIARALDQDTLLDLVAEAALRQCEADEVSIMLPSPVDGQLRVALARGGDRQGLVGSRQPLSGAGIAGWVARGCEPLVLYGEVDDSRYAPIHPRPEIKSALSMPMVAGNQLVGVLNVNITRQRRRFSAGQMKAMSLLTASAAAALANADLLERVRRAEEKYRAFFEHARDGIFQASLDGRLITANPTMARLLGYGSPEDLMAAVPDVRDLPLRRADRGELLRRLQSAEASPVEDFEMLVRHRDGQPRWLRASIQAVRDQAGALSYLEGTVQDVSGRKQRDSQLAAIAQLSSALRGAANRAEMVPVILDQVRGLAEAEAVDLTVPDPKAGDLVVELASGAWSHLTGVRLAAKGPFFTLVNEQGTPQANIDAQNDLRLGRRDLLGSVKYATAIPLATHGQRFGSLWIGHSRELDDGEIRLLVAVADIAANALRRATLHEQTQQRAEQLAAVNRLGRGLAESLDLPVVYQQLGEATRALLPGTAAVYLWLYDVEHGALRCAYGLDEGQPIETAAQSPVDLSASAGDSRAQVVLTNRPLIVNQSPGGGRPGLLVPLSARGRLVGVIQVEAGQRSPYGAADADLLALVANTAAVAIENAFLFGETQRRLQRLGSLRSIDQAITASFDLRVMLNVLLDQVTAQLGTSAADVLLLTRHTRTLDYAAGRGFRTAALQHTSLQLGQGYAGIAALNRRILYVADLGARKTDFLRSPSFGHEGFVSYWAVPLLAKGETKGVMEVFHRSLLEPDREWVEFLETLAGQAAIAIDNVGLFDDLQRSNAELIVAYDATIQGWSSALDLRDRETEGHTERVTEMTMRLARAMSVPEEELVHARRGALLHDIGKMGIPDSILLKPGPLTEEEWQVMRRHPIYAYEMLAPIAYLRPALDIPYCHHEKWDGSGYPRGLKGEQIPLSARIFAVADVWDALRSDRPYRAAWPEERVREYISQQAGLHFDRHVVNVFLNEL